MRIRSLSIAAVLSLALTACASVHNLPLNKPSADPFAGTMTQMAAAAVERDKTRAHEDDDGTVIGRKDNDDETDIGFLASPTGGGMQTEGMQS